jgi:membrane protease YdiL (CAAX protease family)
MSEIIVKNKLQYFLKWFSKVFILDTYLIILLFSSSKKLLSQDIYRSTLAMCIGLSIVIFLPEFFDKIKSVFVYNITKNNILKVIIALFISCLLVDYTVEFSRYLPVLINSNNSGISVASGQGAFPTLPNGYIQVVSFGLLAAFLEELIFRFIPLTGIFYLKDIFTSIKNPPKYIERIIQGFNYFERKIIDRELNLISVVFILLVSAVFSLSHEPNLLNFHMYFISGILYCIVYRKYGLIPSTLVHGLSNLFIGNIGWYLAKYTYLFVISLV